MSKKKSKSVRSVERVRKAKQKEEKVREFINQYDVHPDLLKRMSKRQVAEMVTKTERAAENRLKKTEQYEQVLADAKLLSIVSGDFEYMGVGVKEKGDVEKYKQSLVQALAPMEGKELPEATVDDAIRGHMEKCLQDGMLVPVKPAVGTLPKLRKMSTGEVVTMKPGDMDFDYMLEQFGVS